MRATRVINFPPSMGLRPRPADHYDLLCLRFYRASVARNASVATAAARELLDRYGSDVADEAYSHGHTLAACVVQ
jgi:hypothetical protein